MRKQELGDVVLDDIWQRLVNWKIHLYPEMILSSLLLSSDLI